MRRHVAQDQPNGRKIDRQRNDEKKDRGQTESHHAFFALTRFNSEDAQRDYNCKRANHHDGKRNQQV